MAKSVILLVVAYVIMGFLFSFLFYPPKEFYKGLKISYVAVLPPFAFAIYKTIRPNKKDIKKVE